MRGRLIDSFAAEIAQLDPATMAADPSGAGPTRPVFDSDFREPVVLPSSVGTDRRELQPIKLPCQIEVQSFEALTELSTGNSPRSHIVLVFHFRDLERAEMVDPLTGDALLRPGDRLVSLRDLRTDTIVQAIRTPPGLYATEVQPQGFGLGRRRNLLFVLFDERALGPRGGVS